jgi:hypothetical protein
MSDNKRFSTDQVSDWAVFYPAEYRMALAVVRFLNGDTRAASSRCR